ncbi:MAG: HU family DNA-binding protein [Elusimicrobiota bacterium]
MTKHEFVQQVATGVGVRGGVAGNVIKGMVKVVQEAMKSGEKVTLSGLGTFKVKARKARIGRNPKTGETVQIPAGKKISFKPSLALRNLIKQ